MKKILVRAPQWLGDAVVCTIFLSRLKERFPEAEIDVCSPSALRPIFEFHPAVHAFVELPYSKGGNIFETGRILRNKNYEVVYILPRSFRTALEMWLAKIPQRIGYVGDLRRLLLTKVIAYDEKVFYAHRYLKLIGEENIPLEGLRPFFPKAEWDDAGASSLLGVSFHQLKRPFLGIAPASIAPARTWEASRFAEVAQKFIQETGGTVFIFGSGNETSITNSVVSASEASIVDTAGKLNLPQLGWILSKMNIFLGNDSGLMHVASAFQIPSVILFGPSDPTWALPQTGQFIALQRKEIDCVPCLRNHCVRLADMHMACMKKISVDEVIRELSKI